MRRGLKQLKYNGEYSHSRRSVAKASILATGCQEQ